MPVFVPTSTKVRAWVRIAWKKRLRRRPRAVAARSASNRTCGQDGRDQENCRHRRLALGGRLCPGDSGKTPRTDIGTFAAVGCSSLHPLENLNACGNGGVLTTNDPGVYEALKIRRNLGLKTREDFVLWSENTRLDTIQAAVLLVKLNYLEQWTQHRRDNARYCRRILLVSRNLPYRVSTSGNMQSTIHRGAG